MNRAAEPAREQRLLKMSIASGIVSAAATVSFGLWSGSRAILFDGFYSAVDVCITSLALACTRLIATGFNDRFQYGYWHFEPLLGLVNGGVLAVTCVYAFLDGLNGLLTGGSLIDFKASAAFSGTMAILSLGMYAYNRRSAAGMDSDFLQIDARGWLMSGALSSALCAAFLVAVLLRNLGVSHLAPYVDPLVLMVVALALLPLPAITLWQAGRDILQIAPPDLSAQVRAAAEIVAERHGFGASTSHVAQIGRQLFVEIGLVARSSARVVSFDELDRIRVEITEAIGGFSPGCWLTVDFTADARWV